MSGGLCLFCDPAITAITDPHSQRYTHERRRCPLFRSLKAGLNPNSYCSTHLNESEARGFAAAGVIFVSRNRGTEPEFLLARELKMSDNDGQQERLNFLGGKRLLSSQLAIDVAVQKANQETGSLLHDASKLKERALPLVYWDGRNKHQDLKQY